ncbi:MAG: hypothetical protein EPN82_04565 [Bacteroidetes bacterium]|nr:MAG: hypothetical protein EPN82_04565 [Bacteroidota bacterium]
MKKFAVILAVLFVAFAINANADVWGDANKTGTGNFKCTIIDPLGITTTPTSGEVDLGEFVKQTAAYTLSAPNTIAFNITGEASHGFYYKITEVETSGGATLSISWDATVGATTAATLSGTGTYTITATANTLTTGTGDGSISFTQTVVVDYNGSL